MALLFLDGFDKYGPANSNSTAVAALLTAGEWTTATGGAQQILAPLSATGQALLIGVSGTVTKTIPTVGRIIGGMRFSSSLGNAAGVQFYDGASQQCGIIINTTGTIQLRNGIYAGGTSIAISSTSITANSTHYLEWDITLGNAANYQCWLDGVSLFNGTADTTATVNNTISGFSVLCSTGVVYAVDDLYLFDTTGTANNAVLLTSPRIETQFPSGDGAVQFAAGAAIVGNSVARGSLVSTAANQLRLRAVTPTVACTLNSISLLGGSTGSGTIQIRPVVYASSGSVPGALMSAGSVVVGITINTAKMMPLTTPQNLSAGVTYWIGAMFDLSVTNGLAMGNAASNEDLTATSTFASGAPGTAPVMGAAVSSVMWGNVTVSGNNWYATSQNPPQGSSSYVFDATVGHEDLFTFPALSAAAPTIYAVAVKASVAKSDAGAKTVSVRAKSGATDSGGSAGALAPGTSYAWLTSLFPTDPNTSAAWTLAALNVAQAGVKVEVMTDINNAGTPREVLFTTVPAATAAGVVREALIATPTAATLAGVIREILMLGPPLVAGGQYAVTVNSG